MCARLTLLIRQRTGSGFAVVDLFAAVEIGVTALSFIVVLASNRLAGVLRQTTKTGVYAFILMLVLGVISAAWSPMPAFSAYRAASVLSQFLLALLIFHYEASWRQAELRMLQLGAVVVIFQLLSTARLSGWGAMVSLKGLHSNTFPVSTAMLSCYCLGECLGGGGMPARKRQLALMGSAMLIIMAMGTSGGSIMAAIAGLLVVTLLSRRPLLITMLTIACVLASLLVSSEAFLSFVAPGKDASDFETLNGRMVIWADYWSMFCARPLLGHGYAVAARIGTYYKTNTHNIVLGVLLGTGLAGGGLFLAALVAYGVQIARATLRRIPGAFGCLGALVAALVNGMTKGFIGETYYGETFVFFLLFAFGALYVIRSGSTARSYRIAQEERGRLRSTHPRFARRRHSSHRRALVEDAS